MQKAWDKYPTDFTHVTEREGLTYTSVIDHFFWNHQQGVSVKDAGVIHLPENTSDHCPVFCKYTKRCSIGENTERNEKKTKKPASWNSFTDKQKELYTNEVHMRLQDIDILHNNVNCHNVLCENVDHRSRTDTIMACILGVLQEAAAKAKPDTRKKGSKPKVPSWKEEVEPLQEKARF